MNRMRYLIGIIVLFLLGLLSISIYKFIESQGPAQQIIKYQKEEEDLHQAIGKLYYDEGRVFPRTDINSEDLERIEINVKRYTEKVGQDNIIQFDYQHYLKKVQAQEVVNGLYSTPQIIDNQFQAQSPLKKDLDYAQVKEWYRKYYFKKAQDDYEEQINYLLTYAKTEQEGINKAYQELNDLKHIPIEPQYRHVISLAVKDIVDMETQLKEPAYLEDYSQDADDLLSEVIKKIKKWDENDQYLLVQESDYIKNHLSTRGGTP